MQHLKHLQLLEVHQKSLLLLAALSESSLAKIFSTDAAFEPLATSRGTLEEFITSGISWYSVAHHS